MSAIWGGEQTSNRQARWVTLVILVVILTAWHAYGQDVKQGHVEWVSSAVDAHSANVWVGNDMHTVDCNREGCAVDSAYGYAVAVLADGTKQIVSGSLLAQAARIAATSAPVPTQQQALACIVEAGKSLSKQEKKQRAGAIVADCSSSRPVWPTFNYTISEGVVVVK